MLKLLVFINSLLAVFTIFSYLSGYINPDVSGFIALFGLIYPYLLLLNIFFILFWLIVKWKYALISLFAIILGFSHVFSFYGIPDEKITAKDSKELTFGSFNINSSYYLSDKDKKISEERISLIEKQFLNTENRLVLYSRIKLSYPKNVTQILTQLPFDRLGKYICKHTFKISNCPIWQH